MGMSRNSGSTFINPKLKFKQTKNKLKVSTMNKLIFKVDDKEINLKFPIKVEYKGTVIGYLNAKELAEWETYAASELAKGLPI